MTDGYLALHQDYTIRTPAAQEVLPVPITYWDKLKERILETRGATARLEALGWAAIGAALSFLAVVITLPFSVEWSKTTANVQNVNWAAVITEGVAVSFTLLFLAVGILSLYWANVKQKLQARMGEWLVADMTDFEARHSVAGT